MAKKRKQPKWDRKPCGCVKTNLPKTGKVLIRCSLHHDKRYRGKRVLCFWDDSGLVQRHPDQPSSSRRKARVRGDGSGS